MLRLRNGGDGLISVPPLYTPEKPLPFLVLFHGAGGNPMHFLNMFQSAAARYGIILLAFKSRRDTWDAIRGRYRSDMASLRTALGQVFADYAIDDQRVAIAGFSDGASYALSVGLANGDVFHFILAFSPGFAQPIAKRGDPRIFISHGVRDSVLPIDRCSRALAENLRNSGYQLRYREFEGAHTVPPDVVFDALSWFSTN